MGIPFPIALVVIMFMTTTGNGDSSNTTHRSRRFVFGDADDEISKKEARTQLTEGAVGFCTTYSRSPSEPRVLGQCLPVSKCPELLQYLAGPKTDFSYLRRSLCRVINAKPYICCPIRDSSPSSNPEPISRSTSTPSIPKLFPDPHKGECGLFLPDRIVGGDIAPRGAWPWMALLFYKVPDERKEVPACGGTLINSRYVMTAAHCVSPDDDLVYVRLGEYDIRSDPDCDPPNNAPCSDPVLNAKIEEITVHPDFTKDLTVTNDVALIRLTEDVDFYKVSALPVCLPFDPRDVEKNGDTSLPGLTATVTGWGRTGPGFLTPSSDVLLELSVPIIPIEECLMKPIFKRLALGKEHLCAGGESGKDSCQGDSGGPLVVPGTGKNEQIFYQVGIVSFGDKYCGYSNIPGVYARVSTYLPWIQSVVKP